MTNYLEILSTWMNEPQYLLIVLIMVYVVAATVDFLVGTVNAAYTRGVQFSSRVSQLGIMRKIVTLMVMILIIPLALMLPLDVAIYSLTILYVGIAGSEVYSILGHIGIVKDGNKDRNNMIGGLFDNILGNVFKEKGIDKDDNKPL